MILDGALVSKQGAWTEQKLFRGSRVTPWVDDRGGGEREKDFD